MAVDGDDGGWRRRSQFIDVTVNDGGQGVSNSSRGEGLTMATTAAVVVDCGGNDDSLRGPNKFDKGDEVVPYIFTLYCYATTSQ